MVQYVYDAWGNHAVPDANGGKYENSYIAYCFVLYLSIVFIPMSFFELNGRIIFIVIGYSCLIIGGILTIFKACLESYRNRKDKKR